MFTPEDIIRLNELSLRNAPMLEVFRELARLALELTDSRNALVALVDEDIGEVTIRLGVGSDMDHIKLGMPLNYKGKAGDGVVAAVAAKGEAVLLGDVTQDQRYREVFPNSLSELAVPVLDRYERVRAVLNVESDVKQRYRKKDQRICEAIASMMAQVIGREDTRRREEALLEIGSALDRSTSREDLIKKVLMVAQEVLEFQACSIFLYDVALDKFVLRGSSGNLKEKTGEAMYKPLEGCTGWVCAAGVPLRLDNPQSDERWAGLYLEFNNDQVASYLAVPILLRGRSIGALRVIRRKTDNPFLDVRFNEEDQRLLVAIAEQIATGLENLRNIEKALQEERLVAWGELSAKSSHMIGNRVFAIKGDVNELAYSLDQEALDRDDLKDILKSLETNVERIDEILQDFRDYLTASQVSRVNADFNFMIKESVMEVFPRKGPVSLVWLPAEGLPDVQIDSSRFRRAIGEIVENALSYFAKGKFIVETGLASEEQIKQSGLRTNEKYVVASFTDQGPGVKDNEKTQIFEPFFTSRVKGMGLGLSIVKGIIAAHGGTVIEDGKFGEGAKFVVFLPGIKRLEK